jgi:spore maturation protein CgeB
VIQKEPFTGELEALGVRNVLYLPLAAQPACHRPLALTPAERGRFGSDISFMGAGYPNRRRAFGAFSGYDFKIWGTEWEGEAVLEPLVQMGGERVSPEDTVRIFNACKINLNLHSGVKREQSVTHGDFVNPRTFEIAACGAFQLVDRRSLLPELFAPEELAVFDSLEELRERVDYYLERPEERAAIAGRGRARVLSGHTYAARMSALLAFARERLADWPRLRGPAGGAEEADLPPELRRELDRLLRELQLPPGTDFATLIAALRGRSGRLSPLESALLFLDEWKKQYSVSH